MPYAIDLSPRQSNRTLEQAIRHGAELHLEPRIWNDGPQLIGRLDPTAESAGAEAGTLTLVVQPGLALQDHPDGANSIGLNSLRELVSTYCDVVLPLGEHRYMFSTDIIRVEASSAAQGQILLQISRPTSLQVSQRRRFRRLTLSNAAQVDLHWTHDDQARMGAVGWLYNIGGDGMACRTDERVADMLWIGEQIELEFTLAPGDVERFCLEGMLCNKTPTGSLGKVILGIQFYTDESHAKSAQSVKALRQRLVERQAQLADSQKGADL